MLVLLAVSTLGLVGFEMPERVTVRNRAPLLAEPCASTAKASRQTKEHRLTTQDQLNLILCKMGYALSGGSVPDAR